MLYNKIKTKVISRKWAIYRSSYEFKFHCLSNTDDIELFYLFLMFYLVKIFYNYYTDIIAVKIFSKKRYLDYCTLLYLFNHNSLSVMSFAVFLVAYRWLLLAYIIIGATSITVSHKNKAKYIKLFVILMFNCEISNITHDFVAGCASRNWSSCYWPSR